MTDIEHFSWQDHQVIANALARYCHLIDSGRVARLFEEIFAPDAVLDYGGEPLRDPAAQRALFSIADGRDDVTAHFIGSIAIEGHGAGARSVCYFQSWRWEPECAIFGRIRAADMVGIGQYIDEWKQTDRGWRIAHRRLEPVGGGPLALGRPLEVVGRLYADRVRGDGPAR